MQMSRLSSYNEKLPFDAPLPRSKIAKSTLDSRSKYMHAKL